MSVAPEIAAAPTSSPGIPPRARRTLKEARLAAGASQTYVARRMGVGQPRISAVENTPLEQLMWSTIRDYLEALGAAPAIVAQAAQGPLEITSPGPKGAEPC